MSENNHSYKKSLKYSIIDGCAYSVMTGFGETYLSPFAIFLNAGNTIIGLLAALPQLVGTFAQLLSANLLDRTLKRKPLIIPEAIVQMFLWLPIFVLPFLWPAQGPILLLIMVALYMGAINFTIPPWSSLMGDLVPTHKRGDYFGKRNRVTSIFVFVSMLSAGFILHLFKPVNEWLGFAIIFAVAFIARGVSSYYLAKMKEPPYQVSSHDCFTLWDFIRRSPKSNFARFVFYVALINFAVLISGPFFTVYMLRDLGFSYGQFTIINAVNMLSQVLSMRYWGRLGDRFGNKKIITVTGWLIPFVPILWLFSADFYWLLIAQVAAGVIWSGFAIGSSNYLFDAVSPPKRARCVAYSSLFTNSGMFLGAMLGGVLSNYCPTGFWLVGWEINLVSSLQILFLVSGLVRGVISAVFLPLIREVREVENITTWRLIFQMGPVKVILGPVIELFSDSGKKNL